VPDFWVWRYALKAAGVLNAKTGRDVYEGALIRVGEGFGCVHPWPELGDASLDECLHDLGGRAEMALVRQSLKCAEVDGAARMEGRSLFEGLLVPRSHASLPLCDEGAVAQAVERGFTHVKVKAGREVRRELEMLRSLIAKWPELRWRIDFNEMGEAEELKELFGEWDEAERAAVDFLEDPVSYNGGDWQGLREETGLALANDRHVDEERGDSDVLVVKPALHEIPARGRRRVVTSYLDHPLGQIFAAWEAARAGIEECCGLQTQELFEPSEFTERLGEAQPELIVPSGLGLGFGDLLEKLPWTKYS